MCLKNCNTNLLQGFTFVKIQLDQNFLFSTPSGFQLLFSQAEAFCRHFSKYRGGRINFVFNPQFESPKVYNNRSAMPK